MANTAKNAAESKKVGAKSKLDAAAEKAYTGAAAKAANADAIADAVETDKPAGEPKMETVKKAVASPAQSAAAKKAPVKAVPTRKAAATKTAAKTAPAKKTTAKKTPAKKAPAKASPVNASPAKGAHAQKVASAASKSKIETNPATKLKETIMATAENTDFTATVQDFATDMQERVKIAYSKSGELAGEMGEFNKANLDAMVESGKIFFTGAQDLVRDNVESGKTVVETMTEDAKKMAAIKSPTELMEFQGELVRRNFDAMVSFGSESTEAWLKLYNDAFAPISNRVSVATEKMTKAA